MILLKDLFEISLIFRENVVLYSMMLCNKNETAQVHMLKLKHVADMIYV
jgi:hypothetical protein